MGVEVERPSPFFFGHFCENAGKYRKKVLFSLSSVLKKGILMLHYMLPRLHFPIAARCRSHGLAAWVPEASFFLEQA